MPKNLMIKKTKYPHTKKTTVSIYIQVLLKMYYTYVALALSDLQDGNRRYSGSSVNINRDSSTCFVAIYRFFRRNSFTKDLVGNGANIFLRCSLRMSYCRQNACKSRTYDFIVCLAVYNGEAFDIFNL